MSPGLLKTGTPKIGMVIILKKTVRLYNAVIGPKDIDGLANSVDPDQNVPFRSVLDKNDLSPTKIS